MKKLFSIVFIALAIASCSEKNKYDVSADKTYEKSKVSLEETEKKNPESFLRAAGDQKKNLIGQTVVKGTIFNSAKMVTFKDITLKLSFYSKTGAVLEEDVETVYETVEPGDNVHFKSKYFTPKGTDSVAMKITGAKY